MLANVWGRGEGGWGMYWQDLSKTKPTECITQDEGPWQKSAMQDAHACIARPAGS